MKKQKIIFISISFAILMIDSSLNTNAAVDGVVGSLAVQDRVAVTGTVTKDIPYTDNIFKEDYDGGTFTLPYSLRAGEIYDYTSTLSYPGYGNISATPAEMVVPKYNSSGYLDLLDWTETDAGTVLTTVADVETGGFLGAPHALRMYATSTNTANTAYLSQTLTSPISTAKYLVFGAYINQETGNWSASQTSFAFRMYDTAGNALGIYWREGQTAWTSGTYGTEEYIYFDDDAGDCIFVQKQISSLDALQSTFDFTSVTSLKLYINPAGGSAPWNGTISIDIFALAFLDSPLKAGLDSYDEHSSANDYVVMNVTDPSSADINIRTIDPAVSSLINADIDFIYTPSAEKTFHKATLSIDYEYNIMVELLDDWETEVTLGTMTLYYVMGSDESDYTEFELGGIDQSALLLNEEKGDAVSLGTIVSDTLYVVTVSRTYSEAEYNELYSEDTSEFSAWLTNAWSNTVAFVTSQNFLIIGGITLALIIGVAVWSSYRKKNKGN